MLTLRRSMFLLVLVAACGEVEPVFVDGGPDDVDANDATTFDPTVPQTTLTVTPAALSNQATARFEFSADRPATFACRVDGGAAMPCTSPHAIPVADGPHLFDVTATTASGVTDPSPAMHEWRVDTVAPDTSFQQTPAALDNSTTVRFEFRATESSTFTCTLDSGATLPCAPPHSVAGLTDGAHTFTVRATDLAGNAELAPAVHTWSLDTSTPDTQIAEGPSGAVASTAAHFTFASPDAGGGATFECALDAAAFAACTSPRDLAGLAEGAHGFRVRVRDATGNYDPTPAERQWTVDTIAPTASVTSIAVPTRDTTPTFAFTTAGSPETIECRMGAAAFAPCTSATSHTPPALADGVQTLEVRVTDAAGNTGTATGTVTIDTVAPTATIALRPSPTGDTTPDFTFSTAGSPVTIQCRMNATPFGACTSPTSYTPPVLAEGNHTFEVSVADAAGNTGSATAAVAVDTTSPAVTIAAMTGPTRNPTPTFTFSTSGSPVSFQCRMGAAAFAPCTTATSHTPAALADGVHTLEVRVTDAAGNNASDTEPVTIDTVAPAISIGAITTPTADATPTFPFTAGADAVTVRCRMDAAAFGACSTATSHTAAALSPDGNHSLEVQVTDLAGNTRSATATVSLDTTGPEAIIFSGPADGGLTRLRRPTFGIAADGSAVSIECRMDTQGYLACPMPNSYTPTADLADGVHTVSLRARDALGNTTLVTRTFTVDTTPPTLTWVSVPTSPSGVDTFIYRWQTSGGVVMTECRPIYPSGTTAPAYAGCNTPHTVTIPGHTGTVTMRFDVKIYDAAGNEASYSDTFSHSIVQ